MSHTERCRCCGQSAGIPLMDSQLPDLPMPTVSLYRDQLVRFREDYEWVARFAAEVCRVDIRTFCRLDVDAYRERNWPDKYRFPWFHPEDVDGMVGP